MLFMLGDLLHAVCACFLVAVALAKVRICVLTCVSSPYSMSGWMYCGLYLAD